MTDPDSPSDPAPARRPLRPWAIGIAAVAALLAILDLQFASTLFAWAFVLLLAGALALFAWRPRPARDPAPTAAAPAANPLDPAGGPRPLRELFRQSLTLGVIGFGGGLAVLSQIEQRLVERERWMPPRRFLEAAALAQSLPGAVATNALALIGLQSAGAMGALAAVVGFILPSFLMLLAFGIVYPQLRHLGYVDGIFRGLSPAVAALVLTTAVRLGSRVAYTPDGQPGGWRALWRDRWSLVLMLAAGIAVAVIGIGVVEVILLAGLLGLLRGATRMVPGTAEAFEARWRWLRRRVWDAARAGGTALSNPWWRRWRERDEDDLGGAVPLWVVAALLAPPALAQLVEIGTLMGVFLRAGAITFGGGFVMIPLLEAELVRTHFWLSPRAFADAMALGQITPGPVVITATFVGYTVAGLAGAILATAAVFAPAFLMVLVVGSSVERFRKSATLQAFLQGVQPAVVGLMFAAAVSLARTGIHDGLGVGIGVLAFVLLRFARISPVHVLLGAAVIGLIARS